MGRFSGSRSLLLAGCAVAAITAAAVPASAGGFAVREQSSEFQGMSFAGDAASGGGLSGMFWNPAIAAYAPKGYSSESDATGIFGHVDETALAGSTLLVFPGLSADSGNMAKPALVPASYMAYRLDPNWVLALSINSPFGLTTDPSNNAWVGQTQARFSGIKTYDFTPTIAYRLSPQLSVGAGLQIDYIEGTLRDANGFTPSAPDAQIKGSDTAVGYTLGLNWTPSPQTSIGLGYRSALSHNLKGTLSSPVSSTDISAALTLPDIVTLSARQAINEHARMTGTIEWTHWSDLQSLVTIASANGATLNTLNLGWHDSWMYALGGEFDMSRQLTLRTGVAYELSPIQNPSERTAKLPDQNRLWLSGGASYALSNMIGLDLAYSHIWGLGGGIDRTEPTPLGKSTLIADVNSSVDIISGSIKFKMNP